jgi:molecular chaperone GrpE
MTDGDNPVDAPDAHQPTAADQADAGVPPGAGPDAPAGDAPAGGPQPGVEDSADSDPLAAADEQAPSTRPTEGDDDRASDPMTALALERDDYRDALVRLQADFENYKKRMIKQQTDHLERAAGALVEKLLPVLDTADLALAHGSGEDVKQLAGTLSSALEREGLERIDPLGTPFDPTLHDAVAHEPGEGGQEVVEVLRAGYRWKGKVLRPAMVKVRG